MTNHFPIRALGAVLVAFVALGVACGGGDASNTPASGAANAPAAAATPFDTTDITPAMVALGDSIFHGLIGATSCQACHGPQGKNGAAAPDLTDGAWLHSDGSLQGIYQTIKTGVMQPKEFVGMMPPYGGVQMSEERTRAVAAYVYRIGHP